MSSLDQLINLLKLKEVERATPVQNRKESSAEHTYGCLMIANYFIRKFSFNLNESKVNQLLLYHDLIEIESGDTYFMDEEKVKSQKARERSAFEILKDKLPKEIVPEYASLFDEFEKAETAESKFAHAIDKLEPMIYMLNYKQVWKERGFTEQNIRAKKQKSIEPFPEILSFFNEIINYLKNNDYFIK